MTIEPKKPGLIARKLTPLKSGLLALGEGVAGLLSLVGAPVALFVGKLFFAAILVGVACGVWLKFTFRARAKTGSLVHSEPLTRWPAWLAAALATAEIAALVESTKLAVRTDQPGFEQSSWVLVLLAWGLAFYLQRTGLRQWLATKKRTKLPVVRS
jgi:hypothetical protein